MSGQRHATVVIHPAFTIADVDPRLFGSFVEHLGRGVYGGIVDPTDSTADRDGFRSDVAKLVRELGVTTVRYPGGNFVSGYDWRDGVGPVERRPRRLDPAWHSIESNHFGVDDFVRWCRSVGADPMLAVNLGTDDIRSALHLLEYANHPGGTTLSDTRILNGAPRPHDVRMWCLGNEMDGPWQIGHLTATEYGRLAARTGAAMKMIDPDLQLVVCGSSNDRVPTFGAWEHDVLTETVGVADFISCHQYFRNDGDLDEFLASGLTLDRMIGVVAAAITQVKAAARSDRHIAIAFDEWNVWDWQAHDQYAARRPGWSQAPALLEDRYTVADAVVVGDLLIGFLNHADVVRAASLAQLVNVISPIVAEPGRAAWRQTTFHPFADVRRSAGSTALRTAVTTRAAHSEAPHVTAAAAMNQAGKRLDVYIAHRDIASATTVEIDLRAFPALTGHATVLHHPDPLITNSSDEPDRVVPTDLALDIEGGTVTCTLPPVAFATLRLGITA